jgi:hypothetical protein
MAYNATFRVQCEIHNIRKRTDDLAQQSALEGFPPTIETATKITNLHRQMDEIHLCAERSCLKILKPESAFSPPVQFWYDKIHAYQALIRLKEGKHPGMNHAHVCRTALRKSIPDPKLLTIEKCKEGIRLAKLQQRAIKANEIRLWQSHLANCLQTAVERGDDVKQREIKTQMRAEHNKRVWGSINRVTQPRLGRTCLQTQETVDGLVITHTSQAAVEQSIKRECKARFRLGHLAPIEESELGAELCHLSESSAAVQIIQGEYEIPPGTDQYTAMVLQAIGDIGKTILRQGLTADRLLTVEECQHYWRRIKENTSSSPSGIHHGHWKATTGDREMAELVTDQMNLIIQSGIPPERWGVALQVLLEKVAGDCSVDRLCSIQLYEAVEQQPHFPPPGNGFPVEIGLPSRGTLQSEGEPG